MNYITGDLHGETKFLWNQIKLHSIKAGDRVFLCGDTGLVWDNCYWEIESLNMLNDMGIEILIVDGNHENFNLLYRFPTEVRYGNEVGVIRPNIIHLKRGLIYTIDGKSIFVMGGAQSTDEYKRTIGVDWWPEERQTYAEQERALNSLDDVNWTVDYVITHTAPAQAEPLIKRGMAEQYGKLKFQLDHTTEVQFLTNVCKDLKFKAWYFGHFHIDKSMWKFHCLWTQTKIVET